MDTDHGCALHKTRETPKGLTIFAAVFDRTAVRGVEILSIQRGIPHGIGFKGIGSSIFNPVRRTAGNEGNIALLNIKGLVAEMNFSDSLQNHGRQIVGIMRVGNFSGLDPDDVVAGAIGPGNILAGDWPLT